MVSAHDDVDDEVAFGTLPTRVPFLVNGIV